MNRSEQTATSVIPPNAIDSGRICWRNPYAEMRPDGTLRADYLVISVRYLYHGA